MTRTADPSPAGRDTAVVDAQRSEEGPQTDAVRSPGKPTSSRWVRSARELLIKAVPILGLLAIWWALTATILDRPRIYPPPDVVWDELLRLLSGEGPLGSTYGHFGATMFRLFVAFVLAFVSGTLVGVLAGRKKGVFDFLDNLVWVAMAVPSIVWVFIFVIAIGISNVVPIGALIVLLAPPVVIAVAEGTKSIPDELVTLAQSYQVKGWQRLKDLYLPSVVPYMAASARVTFALGIKIVIIAEVIGLPSGVGLLLKYWFDKLFMGPIVAWGIVLIVVGMAADRLVFAPLERRASKWAPGAATVEVRTE